MLKGADKLLNDKINELLVCAYHKNEDEQELSEILQNKKYKIKLSPGYMLMINEKPNYSLVEPFYFRKGLIYAKPD